MLPIAYIPVINMTYRYYANDVLYPTLCVAETVGFDGRLKTDEWSLIGYEEDDHVDPADYPVYLACLLTEV